MSFLHFVSTGFYTLCGYKLTSLAQTDTIMYLGSAPTDLRVLSTVKPLCTMCMTEWEATLSGLERKIRE